MTTALTEEQKELIRENRDNINTGIVYAVLDPLGAYISANNPDLNNCSEMQFVKDVFNATHSELMKIQKKRFAAEDLLYSLSFSNKAGAKQRLAEVEEEVAQLQKEWHESYEAFLNARRWEEFTRCLPAVMEDRTPEQVISLANMVLLTACWSPELPEIQESRRRILTLLERQTGH